MKEKEKLLVNYLRDKNDWVKSQELATILNVSSRTVRNYINHINNNFSESFLIESSHLGYQLNETKLTNKQSSLSNKQEIFQTPTQRMYYLLQQLVILSSTGIDIYDMSDHLYISIPTIEKDLQNSKAFLFNFNLELKRNHDRIYLHGSEKDKRKLMSAIYYADSSTNFYNIVELEKEFNYDLHSFKRKLLKMLEKNDLNINEYTIGNILFHIIISVQRIKDNQQINHHSYKTQQYRFSDHLIEEIKLLIEDTFNVSLNKFETDYLSLLLESKATQNTYYKDTSTPLNNNIDCNFLKLTQTIIKEVNQNYLIDLTDDDFISKFVLHLKNISIRNSSGFISKNPLTKTIKYSSPLVYDLSVFIANIIMGREDWDLNDDEIAYIALHVGSCIELKKRTIKKVAAVLICPDYYDTHKFIHEEILNQLGNHLHIKHIVTHIDKSLLNLNADLFITTMPISFNLPSSLVTITPFATNDDIKVIQQEIEKVKQRESINIIKKDLFSLFDERLFLKDKVFSNKIKVIRYLGGKMESLGKVHEDFIDDVIKREKMSSTAFNNIVAVPHSLHMNTPSSCISIYIPDTPIKWGNSNNVRLVALIAMDKNNRRVYLDIYDQFIKVLSDPSNISILIDSKNYEDFIEILYCLMEKSDTESTRPYI